VAGEGCREGIVALLLKKEFSGDGNVDKEFEGIAQFLKDKKGCKDAIALDGGGSTSINYNGADGQYELRGRAIGNVLIAFPLATISISCSKCGEGWVNICGKEECESIS